MEKEGDRYCCRFCQRPSCVTRGDPNCFRTLQRLDRASQGGAMGDDDLMTTADVVGTGGTQVVQGEGYATGIQPVVNEGFQHPITLTDDQRAMLGGV